MRLSATSPVTGLSNPMLGSRDTLQEWGHLSVEGSETGVSMSHHRSEAAAICGPQERPAGPFYNLAVPLRLSQATLFLDDGRYETFDLVEGEVRFRDCEQARAVELHDPFDAVEFWIDKTGLDEFSYVEELSSPSLFDDVMAEPVFDRVLLELAKALVPSSRDPGTADPLFVSSLLLAAKIHAFKTYWRSSTAPGQGGVRLAVWQQKRVREVILDNLESQVTIEELAGACGLSPAHFARAFKNSTGLAPHQWRTRRRVAKAKLMLVRGTASLSEIASACGFVDQSHLTKVFKQLVGSTPGAWRND